MLKCSMGPSPYSANGKYYSIAISRFSLMTVDNELPDCRSSICMFFLMAGVLWHLKCTEALSFPTERRAP